MGGGGPQEEERAPAVGSGVKSGPAPLPATQGHRSIDPLHLHLLIILIQRPEECDECRGVTGKERNALQLGSAVS